MNELFWRRRRETFHVFFFITTARVTIENFWARRGPDAGETRARTFTNFDVGTVYFRHMGVQVSRICTIFYVKSVLKIFASFTVIMYVSILARVPPKKSQLLHAPYIVTFWFLQVDNSYVSLHRWTAKMQTGSYVSLHRRHI